MEMLSVEQVGRAPRAELGSRRAGRLRIVLTRLTEKRSRATSRQMERPLGHWRYAALARRCALSTARALYDFSRAGFQQEFKLSPSVTRELRVLCALNIR